MIRSLTSSMSARRSARYPSLPSFSLASRKVRRTAHSALSSSSRTSWRAPSTTVGSSAIIRWASRMSPCSPSPRLSRMARSCSTESFTAVSSRAISLSTCSGAMWNRGTRARRRSTGNTRPIATPGEAGMPRSRATVIPSYQRRARRTCNRRRSSSTRKNCARPCSAWSCPASGSMAAFRSALAAGIPVSRSSARMAATLAVRSGSVAARTSAGTAEATSSRPSS